MNDDANDAMTMMNMTMTRIFAAAAAVLLACLPTRVAAQPKTFSLGPPLRSNAVFSYRYVERVTEVDEMAGHRVDSTQRLVTYYISQRQSVAPEGKGVLTIEVNVDSMKIDVGGTGENLHFNTQEIAQAQDQHIVSHRDVFAPSLLVNRVVTFTITPYGQILRVESAKRDEALRDVAEANLEPFVTERIKQVLTDEYLASVLLPWRGVVPLGQTVAFGAEKKIPYWTSFDRTSFRDTARVTIVMGPDSAAHVRYQAKLDRPRNTLATISAFEEPVTITSMHGDVAGDLKLEQDGVVLSGWTITTGTLTTKRLGTAVRSSIRHEVYVEIMGTSPLTN